MITHVVIWTLHPQADGRDAAGNAAELAARLTALLGVIPGLRSIRVGRNRELGGAFGDVARISEHDDWAALQTYQDHPAHQAVKAFVGAIARERRCVDF
jgi:hypothetical protein